MSTLITYEEWWRWESQRRRRNPFCKPSSIHGQRVCRHCAKERGERKAWVGAEGCYFHKDSLAVYEKVIVSYAR